MTKCFKFFKTLITYREHITKTNKRRRKRPSY